MPTKAEIIALFKLDDKSKETLDSIKDRFKTLDDKIGTTAGHVTGFFKEAAATALGFQLAMNAGAIVNAGKEAFTKAMELENTQKSLTGILSMSAKAGTNWETLTRRATEFNTQLDAYAAKTGIAKNTAIDLYTVLSDTFNTSRSFITASGQSITLPLNQWEKAFKRTDEDIKKLMTNIGTAGNAVAGGPQALAMAFQNFSAQGAKATDPIVQMIAATGTLKGNAKQVAQQLNMLTDASAMSFAQVAIGKMAKQMVDAPATMQSVMGQLGNMKDRFLEGFGGPILKAVVPALDQFRQKLENNKHVIEGFSKMMSEKVTSYIMAAAKAIEKGFDYVVKNADSIKKAISSGFEMAEKVFKFILAHKEEIAVAFGAKAVLGTSGMLNIAGGMGAMLKNAGSSYLVGSNNLVSATPQVGKLAGVIGTGPMAGAATGMAAFTAAIAGVGLAVWQATKYIEEFGAVLPWHVAANDDLKATMNTAKQWLDGSRKITREDYEMLNRNLYKFGEAAGYTGAELNKMADAMRRTYEEAKKQQQLIDEAEKAAQAMRDQMNKRYDDEQAGKKPQADDFVELNNFLVAYNTSVQNNNKVQMQAIAKMFEGNAALQQAFLASGASVEGGFELLASMIDGASGDFADKLKKLAKAPEMNQKGKVEFNNNTFNMKQDFRDQDPDRVAMIFQRDIINAAENRRNSKVGGVFGS